MTYNGGKWPGTKRRREDIGPCQERIRIGKGYGNGKETAHSEKECNVSFHFRYLYLFLVFLLVVCVKKNIENRMQRKGKRNGKETLHSEKECPQWSVFPDAGRSSPLLMDPDWDLVVGRVLSF